uniref:Uncharacterized protein n=1 Tax=Ralstonia solanacearum TaxID=305 RepID=A0A0S4UXN3_RALSL|nr:protein of unknown function [Ralstonia solanacearum]
MLKGQPNGCSVGFKSTLNKEASRTLELENEF